MDDYNEYLNELENQFNSQTPEEIQHLIYKAQFNLRDDSKIKSILRTIRKNKTITFNQWKAIRATLSTKNNPIKKI